MCYYTHLLIDEIIYIITISIVVGEFLLIYEYIDFIELSTHLLVVENLEKFKIFSYIKTNKYIIELYTYKLLYNKFVCFNTHFINNLLKYISNFNKRTWLTYTHSLYNILVI